MNLLPVLGAVVDVTSGEGEHVKIDPMGPMLMSAVYLFMIILPILIVLLIVFYKKKYQHQQILAAIEKGIPITDLIAKPVPQNREINWIRSLSTGIGLLFVAISSMLLAVVAFPTKDVGFMVVSIVAGGVGVIYLLQGILQRKYGKKQENLPPIQPE